MDRKIHFIRKLLKNIKGGQFKLLPKLLEPDIIFSHLISSHYSLGVKSCLADLVSAQNTYFSLHFSEATYSA